MFSIIIPLYNKANYIEKAIKSVIAQTYQEFELIVVNDGSIDLDDEALEKGFESTPLHDLILLNERAVYMKQPNQGVSVARNNGVKQAKNRYICFLDADDWWKPDFLEKMRELILEYPDAGIYGCRYELFKNGNYRNTNIGLPQNFEKGLIDYCSVYSSTLSMPLWTGAVVIPKNVIESENGFKPGLKLGEDFDLWIRIALKYPVIFINKVLAVYNQDVEAVNRAVVNKKLFEPSTHYIFNIEYLQEQENQNPKLKYLLDRLRVYTLLRYRIQNAYIREVNREIAKVDFSKQSFKTLLQFKLPIFFIMIFYQTKDKIIKLIKTLINEKNH